MSGSEVAYFSLTHDQLAQLEDHGLTVKEKRILKLVDQPGYLLATILIANNLFNIAIIMTTNYLCNKIFKFSEFYFLSAESVNFVVTVVVITFILVLFGEVLPKVYATNRNLELSKFTSGPLSFFRTFFNPISAFLVGSTKIIENRLQSNNAGTTELNIEEIDKAIELVSGDEESAKDDIAMLKGIVKFGNISVKQIMKARVDVVAVEENSNYQDLCDLVIASGHSRIPVYRENFDEIIGLVYAKDLIEYINKGPDFDWGELIRPAYFVPEMKKIDDLLQEFKRQRMHMAIVVDEYGGTSGLVTLEDILEEIVGEITDEFDKENEIKFEQIDESSYCFEGKTPLRDICKILELPVDTFEEMSGESDSLAGLILEVEGDFPVNNVGLRHGNFIFTVLEQEDNRIEKVKIDLLEDETSQEASV
jgi:gliding motility-associated protein GldE